MLVGCVGNSALGIPAQNAASNAGSSSGTTSGGTTSTSPPASTQFIEPAYDDLVRFAQTVWAPTVSTKCYGCHHTGAIAAQLGAGLILADTNIAGGLELNYAMLRSYAALDTNFLILKPTNQVNHYGGVVFDTNSNDYAALSAFITQSREAPLGTGSAPTLASVMAQAVLPTPTATVRTLARVLANRLPTAAEYAGVTANATTGLSAAVDQYLSEGNFYQRLSEAYNDQLLVDSYARTNTAVSLFQDIPMVDWYDHVALTNAQAQVALNQTNWSLAHEPLNMIMYIASHDLPFTDVLTADYTVVNPYTACAYGIADQVVFSEPVHCNVAEQGNYNIYDLQQVSLNTDTTVGVLSSRALLNRHPTTPTNRNRHRFNTMSAIFLGFDALVAVPGRTAPANVALPAPTMTSRSCTDCHAMVDPGAGLFAQWDATGLWTDIPWYTDMFQAGYFGTPMPATTHNRLAWLATQMTQDPRFARQTVRFLYQMLTGNTMSLNPPAATDPNFVADMGGYMVLKAAVDGWAAGFVAGNYSLKTLIKTIVLSPIYQVADAQPTADPISHQILASTLIHHRLITPESLNRDIVSFFGTPWANNGVPLLTTSYYMFYGGIDSSAVTVRDYSFNSFKSGITLRMASELSCSLVPQALSNATDNQTKTIRNALFPGMPSGGAIGLSTPALTQLMAAMRFSLLGEQVSATDPEVAAMLSLFQSVQNQAVQDGAQMLGPCTAGNINADPDGSVRGWMAVVQYLLTDEKFLFE